MAEPMKKSLLSRFARHLKYAIKRRSMQAVFSRIYRSNKWNDPESRSGGGSNLEVTRVLRRELPAILRQLEVRSLLDIPCGDFAWMKEVDLPVERYIGADIVPDAVRDNAAKYARPGREFRCLNLVKDALPAADFVFCRDCLVHLPFREVGQALANIKRSGAKYVALTTFADLAANDETPYMGKWRPLNMRLAPFSLPEPVLLLDEECAAAPGKRLAVWRVADLPEHYPV